MKIVVATAEPENYVPVELAKLGAVVINTNECVVEVDGGVYHNGVPLLDIDVVIPRLNDEMLDQKYQLLRGLEKSTGKMLNSAVGMKACQNKLETINRINEYLRSQPQTEGFKVRQPKTIVITSQDVNVDQALDMLGSGPYVIKTVLGSQGMGVMLADSKISARGIIQYLQSEKTNLMIQEFIKHDTSYRIITLGDEMLASNSRGQKGSADFRTNIAQGATSEGYDPSETEIKVSIELAKYLGCEFVAVDYLMLENEMIILEVNGSPGLEDMQSRYDHNLCEKIINHCSKNVSDDLPAEPEAPELSIELEPAIAATEPAPVATEPMPVDDQPIVINDIEKIIIKRIGDESPLEAKIDTGADSCCLHGENITIFPDKMMVTFTYQDKSYQMWIQRLVNIKQSNMTKQRAVVVLDVEFLGKPYQIETSIADRSDMAYEFLIGKNLLAAANVVIKIDQEKSTPSSTDEELIQP